MSKHCADPASVVAAAAPAAPATGEAISTLIDDIDSVRRDMVDLAERSSDLLCAVHPDHALSSRNLLHYLGLRSHDLRPLQARLAASGLSSLGRAEGHVLSAVEAVLHALHRLRGTDGVPPSDALSLVTGQRLLDSHTEAVFGKRPAGRGVGIMVTMPSEAADDYSLVARLVQLGMDCMRINCAHDDADAWGRMIGHLRRATEQHGRPCRVLMDLAGPKVRTGPLEAGPAVVRIKPRRDAYGRVNQPARLWIQALERPRPAPTPADGTVAVRHGWLGQLECGDRLEFEDARGSSRAMRVVAVTADGVWAEAEKTSYLVAGTRLSVERLAAVDDEAAETEVAPIPPRAATLTLVAGDELLVTSAALPGRNAVRDARGHTLVPASIGCTADRVFTDARSGDQIWFDDGKIAGVIERREADVLHVRIRRTPIGGARLGSEKGINLPDTRLHLPALTDKDLADLAFVAEHADLVALSFVNTADDIRALRERLATVGDRQPAIVLKIETRRGFEELPSLLLEAMHAPRCAVMIARGDLAVECGFERLAEVQEEILWICEAAHVPVIWATQVLETLAKKGLPSRAEVTDAAMAHRAECVMLNKGPHIAEAVEVLDDILRRMHGHQEKKRPMLRPLELVSRFRRTHDG